MSDLQAFVEKYRQHLTVRNYAPRTISGDIFYLNRFFKYLAELNITDISAVTKDTVRDYQTHLYEAINRKGQPNTVSYQNGNLKSVKAFFRFLASNNYLVSDPAKDVSYAKVPKKLPRSILDQREMKKLLHAPNNKTALGYRDRTVLEVLYSSGIRKEELINLQLADVDYHDGFVRINSGKGSKDRVVPIGKIACRYLENYVKAVRPMLIKNVHNNHVFLSLKGNRLSKNIVWEIVKRCSKRAKTKKNVSPHTFRHTCATLMLRNKANIRHIQELLGHASLDTTQVYASVSIADLKEVHKKCHPREKDQE
jgi:integrase/recombinase XerD